MNIEYTAAPTLKRFHEDNSFFRGIRGPIGSGKSVACVIEIMSRAMEMAPDARGKRRSRWAIIRNTVAELRDTTLKTFVEWIPEEICKVTKSPRITAKVQQLLSDGTALDLEVIFMSMDTPKAVRDLLSLELTGVWFNEARELPLDVITNGLSRVGRFPRATDVPKYWSGGIADTNSPDTFSWWYDRAEKHKPDNWAFFDQPPALLKEEDEAGNISYYPNPAAENIKNHSKKFRYYLDMISGADPEWIAVMICCEYKSLFTGKPVYAPLWNNRFHRSAKSLDILPDKPLLLAFDFGLTPACLAGQIGGNGQLRILREWVSVDMGLRQLLRDMVLPDLAIQFRNMRYIVTFDPAGTQRSQVDKDDSCAEELARNGLAGTPARTNDFEPRRRAVINRLSYLAGGEAGYLVDPSCETLLAGFNGGYQFELIQKLDSSGGKRYHETPAKNIFSHIHDANQYLCLLAQPEVSDKQSRETENIARQLHLNRQRQKSYSILD